MSYRQSLVAYWIPDVGIGPKSTMQHVKVPLTDVLNYTRTDGTPQVDIINLAGCNFDNSTGYPLVFDPVLQTTLTDGSVQKLQAAGIKVMISIQGSQGSFGWGSFPSSQLSGFVDYCNNELLAPSGFGLDGIDIDNEYPVSTTSLVPVVKAMRSGFAAGKLVSKALWAETELPALAPYLDLGNIMYYGDDASSLENWFNKFLGQGMTADKMTIGVNAGPVSQFSGSFTSIATAKQLAAWQPAGANKLGMMLWTFCQDIQQFTADPQNQPGLMWPNANDHAWQRAMVGVFEGIG